MNAVDLYNEAIHRVPAYRAFLLEKIGEIPSVRTLEEFEARVPFMSKSDYIMQHPLPDLCLDGRPPCAHLWLRSSGTSKKPFFWPRRAEDEKGFPQGMRKLFHTYVSPEAQPTLVVVGLALGPWGTGMQSSFAFRTIAAEENSGLAVCSPGLQNESIIEVLERISPLYKQTLLLSYPPFAKMVLQEAKERGIDLKSLNIHLMVGGEGITETYREAMWDILGHSPDDLDSVWSLYGSTDFANVGFENPLTIAIRRILAKNNLCQTILGEPDVPMLFQRAPNTSHFEVIDGELVVSRMQGIPLIRYRSGDHVQFIERADLLQRLKVAGYDAEQCVRETGLTVPTWETPFVALYGRIDQAIFFYGAKINVEQVKMALEAPELAPYYNGRFLIRGTENEAGYPMLEIALEASDAWQGADMNQITEQVALALEKVQSEFREVRKLSPDQQHIRLVISPAETFELGWKTRHM
jgi:phenylacetate-CoA ligase